ncbi:hypothetical protein B0H63DRAFT_507529 [Podospora didyma]|uniref:Uncharacterized protein n=1 Tax=Podospora didyma TaxID=330526 RepID=A0AAE0NYK2_9PEZI|nr:hypothetical protein B0H63DRAFT_507529 [Podospora didyma]
MSFSYLHFDNLVTRSTADTMLKNIFEAMDEAVCRLQYRDVLMPFTATIKRTRLYNSPQMSLLARISIFRYLMWDVILPALFVFTTDLFDPLTKSGILFVLLFLEWLNSHEISSCRYHYADWWYKIDTTRTLEVCHSCRVEMRDWYLSSLETKRKRIFYVALECVKIFIPPSSSNFAELGRVVVLSIMAHLLLCTHILIYCVTKTWKLLKMGLTDPKSALSELVSLRRIPPMVFVAAAEFFYLLLWELLAKMVLVSIATLGARLVVLLLSGVGSAFKTCFTKVTEAFAMALRALSTATMTILRTIGGKSMAAFVYKPASVLTGLRRWSRLLGNPDRLFQAGLRVSLQGRMFHVDGDFNGISVKANADTGSSFNVISEQLALSLGLQPEPGTGGWITLPSGRRVHSLGRASGSFKFTGEDKTYHLSCIILSNATHPLILGAKFLRHTETFTRNTHRLVRTFSSFNRLCLKLLVGDEQEFMSGFLNGRGCLAVADTGSDIMVVSSAYAKKMHLQVRRGRRYRHVVQFLDGSKAVTHGFVKGVDWKFRSKDTALRCDFHVIKNLPVDVILSNGLLDQMDVFKTYGDLFVKNQSTAEQAGIYGITLDEHSRGEVHSLENRSVTDETSSDETLTTETMERERARRDQIRDRIEQLSSPEARALELAREEQRKSRWDERWRQTLREGKNSRDGQFGSDGDHPSPIGRGPRIPDSVVGQTNGQQEPQRALDSSHNHKSGVTQRRSWLIGWIRSSRRKIWVMVSGSPNVESRRLNDMEMV